MKWLVTFLAVLLSAGSVQADQWGNTDAMTVALNISSVALKGNADAGDHYTASTGDNVDSIYCTVGGANGAATWSIGIYTVNGGTLHPDQYVAEIEFSESITTGYQTFVVACDVALSDEVTYTLCIGELTGAAGRVGAVDVDDFTDCDDDVTNAVFGSAWASQGAACDDRLCLWVAYTPGGAAPTVVRRGKNSIAGPRTQQDPKNQP